MKEISEMTMDELLELRSRVNGKIGSLKALEKRYRKPERRRRRYLFKYHKDALAFAKKQATDENFNIFEFDGELLYFDGKLGYYVVVGRNTTESHRNIIGSYKYSRIYNTAGYKHDDGRPVVYVKQNTYVIGDKIEEGLEGK